MLAGIAGVILILAALSLEARGSSNKMLLAARLAGGALITMQAVEIRDAAFAVLGLGIAVLSLVQISWAAIERLK